MIGHGMFISQDGEIFISKVAIENDVTMNIINPNISMPSDISIPDLRSGKFTAQCTYIDAHALYPSYVSIDDYVPLPKMDGYYLVGDVNKTVYAVREDVLHKAIDEYNYEVMQIRRNLDDYEWDIAMKADEKPIYYFVEMFNGGRCVKRYKPSVAGLVMKRTGLKMIPVKGGCKV